MPVSDAEFRAAIGRGEANELALLADDATLQDHQYEELARVGQTSIAASLVTNYSVPESALEALAEQNPEYAEMAAGHPNAPVVWKLGLSTAELSTTSLLAFLKAVGASKSEKAKLHRRVDAGGNRTLGEIWSEVRPD